MSNDRVGVSAAVDGVDGVDAQATDRTAAATVGASGPRT